jgi:hypothetical protein
MREKKRTKTKNKDCQHFTPDFQSAILDLILSTTLYTLPSLLSESFLTYFKFAWRKSPTD